MDPRTIVLRAAQFEASDIHLQADAQPTYRIFGRLRSVDAAPVSDEELERFLRQVVGQGHWRLLERKRSVDCAYQPDDKQRFRVNVYYQRGRLSAAFRVLPIAIPPFDSLNLPAAVQRFAEEERGLVLVTGTTSSGKSTTIAALIDHINATQRLKIITIEDPIEYVHHNDKSFISQREVGRDCLGFADALRGALRQDPDVIFVVELRDYETFSTAIRAADTGHLVFSTVHTTDATQTLQRMVAMFPPAERELLTIQLAANLVGVISLRLALRMDEKGRVPVAEIMRNTPIVEKLIMESRFSDLPAVLASREMGMQLFDQHLVELVRKDLIRNREAFRIASNPERVSMVLSGISAEELAGRIVSR